VEQTVRDVLSEQGGLIVGADALDVETDLFGVGMTSHASVNVMLGLEDAFDVEFPDRLLKKSTFRSIASIIEALESLIPAAV
jgi:acyl carrier protein